MPHDDIAGRVDHVDLTVAPGAQRTALPGEICTCGRPAVVIIGNQWGGSGWCGTSDRPSLGGEDAERARVELQNTLGRPLRTSDLPADLVPFDKFDRCYDVLQHFGQAQWRIATGPSHCKTGEHPRYVLLKLEGADPIELSAVDAVSLAADLANRASDLIS